MNFQILNNGIPDKHSFDKNNNESHDQQDEGEVSDEAVDGRGRADLLDPVHVELRVGLFHEIAAAVQRVVARDPLTQVAVERSSFLVK